MSPSRDDDGIIAGINVTPLVDITLVLLVVFIVTAKVMVTPAVALDLPEAAQTEEVQVVLSLVIPARGTSTLNGHPVADAAALVQQAKDELDRNPDLRAVIQADGAVPHRRVIAALDALKTAGISRIAFAAVPPAPAP